MKVKIQKQGVLKNDIFILPVKLYELINNDMMFSHSIFVQHGNELVGLVDFRDRPDSHPV